MTRMILKMVRLNKSLKSRQSEKESERRDATKIRIDPTRTHLLTMNSSAPGRTVQMLINPKILKRLVMRSSMEKTFKSMLK